MTQDEGVSRRAFLFGTAGATAAAAGTAAAQENNSSGGNQTGNASQVGNASSSGNATGNASAGGNTTGGGDQGAGNNQSGGGNQSGNGSGGGGQTVSKTVAVGPNNSFKFEPTEVVITPGSTVTWEWKSDNHNVVPQSQPDGANWPGEGSQGTTFNTGHTYKYTFQTKGTYEYVCTPHESQGMTGTVTVQDTLPTPEPAASQPSVPDSAKSLGVASVFAMIATLGLSFFFLKYGGDYETPEQ